MTNRILKIKISILQKFLFGFLIAAEKFLVFLAFRKPRRFWGVVYDSVSKQPLDPAIVKLLYVDSPGKSETCVTDLSGRYGFLARPGKFKIFAKKSNYTFPSSLVTGENDGVFEDIYRGEFFELKNDWEVIGPNIPMDPMSFDWNQSAKLRVVKTHARAKFFFHTLLRVFLGLLFVFTVGLIIRDFKATGSMDFSLKAFWVLGVYVFLFILNFLIPSPRLWAKTINFQKKSIQNVQLELLNPHVGGFVMAKTVSLNDGRFLLRANPGAYVLRVTTEFGVGEENIRIGSLGVLALNVMIQNPTNNF